MKLFHVKPSELDARGGTLLTVDGEFDANVPLRVVLTVGGYTMVCYSGNPGSGSRVDVYGPTLTVISPALPSEIALPATATLRVERAYDASNGVDWPTSLSVHHPMYPSETFALRGLYPPVDATGPRDLKALQAEGPPLPGAVLPHVLDAYGEAFTAFGGTRSTYLTEYAPKGATTVVVDSTMGLSDDGRVLIGGQMYRFASRTLQSLVGLRAINSTEAGLLQDIRLGDEVIDVTPKARQLGRLHEAYFLDSADGVDLSTCGRNYGLTRDPSIRDDATYAAACLAIAYGPRGTLLGLRMALDAMVGAGNYRIREDTLAFPCRVFVDLPQSLTLAQTSAGRTYLSGSRLVAPSDAQTFRVPAPVYGLNRIVLPNLDDLQIGRGARPAPPWVYAGNDELAEVTVHPDAPGLGCIRFGSSAGDYSALLPADDQMDASVSLTVRLTPSAMAPTASDTGIVLGLVVAGRGFGLRMGSDSTGKLRLTPCAPNGVPLSVSPLVVDSAGYTELRIARRRSGRMEAQVAGQVLTLSANSLPSAATSEAFFGRQGTAGSGSPTVDVGNLRLQFSPGRNYAEARGNGASVASAQPHQITLEQALLDASQVGQSFHLRGSQAATRAPGQTSGPAGSNSGTFHLESILTPTTATVRRFARADGVVGSSANAANQLDLPRPVFSYPADIGSEVVLQGSTSNAGTYFIAQLIDATGSVCTLPYVRSCSSARLVRGNGTVPSFTSQTSVSLVLRPVFANESGLGWSLDQGFTTSQDAHDATFDLLQPLPNAQASYDLTYDDHLGSIIVDTASPVVVLRQEGPPPVYNVNPAYLASPLDFVGNYINSLTAAGVKAVVSVV